MKNDYLKNLTKTNGFLAKYSTQTEIIEKLYLKAIIESYNNIISQTLVGTNFSKEKENDIRNLFIRDFKYQNSYLKNYINHKIIFIASENQANTKNEVSRTDIELLCTGLSFVVECKRLKSAETRYLQGRKNKDGIYEPDGLEKFLNLTYSENDDKAAMVSFIVKGKIAKITEGLKTKVRKFRTTSNVEELSKLTCSNWVHSFQSEHIRNDKTNIHLYHLFFDFSVL